MVSSAMYRSTDGNNWTLIESFNSTTYGDILAVAAKSGVFVCLQRFGPNNTIIKRSSDGGVTWNTVNTSSRVETISSEGNLWTATLRDASETGWSSDGATWTFSSQAAASTSRFIGYWQ
jgi:hypothetical protein